VSGTGSFQSTCPSSFLLLEDVTFFPRLQSLPTRHSRGRGALVRQPFWTPLFLLLSKNSSFFPCRLPLPRISTLPPKIGKILFHVVFSFLFLRKTSLFPPASSEDSYGEERNRLPPPIPEIPPSLFLSIVVVFLPSRSLPRSVSLSEYSFLEELR